MEAPEEVLEDLKRREPIFHRPEFGTMRGELEAMTVEDFWETGASGTRYSRESVLDALDKRFNAPHRDVWETSGFRCQQVAADLFLLTYTLLQDGSRLTRRATLWRRTPQGWKIVYHQGTLVQNASPTPTPEP